MEVLLVLGLTFGFFLARKGNIEAHRGNQTAWVPVVNDILPRRFHVRWWKNLMRLTLAGYWAVALPGLATDYFWYIA